VLKGSPDQRSVRTGKLIFALSVRGGSGATTVAVRSAWHLAEARQRRVLLLDLDLYGGDAALQLDATPTHALREALEQPDRVDDLFLERGVIRVTPRFGLLASLEPFDENVVYQEDAVLSLLGNLLRRYRYVFVDLPGTIAPHLLRVLHLPSMCLMVSNASLVAARDVRRWRERIGPNSPERSTLHILNKSTAHGCLPYAEFVRAAGQEPDIVIDYEREIGLASTLGVKGMANCAALTRAMAPVLRHVSGEPMEPSRSLLSRLFG
jgi:pilus assembly protein CpaE